MGLLAGFLAAVIGGIAMGGLGAIRRDNNAVGAAGTGITVAVVMFFVNLIVFHYDRPMMTFVGLVPVIFIELIFLGVIAFAWDYVAESVSAADIVAWVAVVVFAIVYIAGENSGHDPYKASHLVPVSVESSNQLPASSTQHMVIVSPGIATTSAQKAMSNGIAGQRNYNTYFNLGDPVLQMVDGSMWYVFPLVFDGAGNKRRMHAVMPGYIMVSAENPNAYPVERYDNQYTMIVGEDAGQGAEPQRWAYDHGYNSYLLEDPTLEINDANGDPYYTVTLERPKLGWTFDAPVGVLLINAHTGQITRYALNDVPQWVDRVYSANDAENITNWYGNYAHAGFKGIVGSSNANRYQVSGNPVLVYTGDGHPDWRMLLTSFNSDSAVSKIVIMDAHTGAMRIYTPQEPMGVESTLVGDRGAFVKPSGQGATNVYSNHYVPTDLTLHVIYGHLVWMVTYETGGASSSFVGVGFVDAYHATASNVVFGSSKSAALQNLLTQLASEGSANGNAPGQGGLTTTVTGVVAPAPYGVRYNTSGGQESVYVMLKGDRAHEYIGTVDSVGPALLQVSPGDHVTMQILKVTTGDSVVTMQSFQDAAWPGLKPAGS